LTKKINTINMNQQHLASHDFLIEISTLFINEVKAYD
jgi:hypothetical protein